MDRMSRAAGGAVWWPRRKRLVLLGGAVVGAGCLMSAVIAHTVALRAGTTASISVNPVSRSELYYKPTPMIFTINASGFDNSGGSPVAAYQYALKYDPALLQWVSGPLVGAGTPTPVPVLPCSNSPQIVTWGTATATPTGFVPTYTSTATATPPTTTPTNTPTSTFTPSPSPTPGGYVEVACATISGSASPSGVIGTFEFVPLGTQQRGGQLSLVNVQLLDHNATPIPVTAVGGSVEVLECHDLNSDGVVNGLDINIASIRFGATSSSSNYLAKADVNSDGRINGLDLNILGVEFGTRC